MAVSIHTPTRGATKTFGLLMILNKFQSTRPHGARHVRQVKADLKAQVSIHTPTRGATQYVTISGKAEDVSIHTPTRGATPSIAQPSID